MPIRAEALIKKYNQEKVVDQVSLKVKRGEIVGLLGPNGAGKTTTFYMILGLISPDGGQIFMIKQIFLSCQFTSELNLGLVIYHRRLLFLGN